MKTETKNCQNCKQDFQIDSEDFNFYEKIKVPPPTFCHLCRAQRRFAFRNERKLFKVTDAFTGKEIFSTYPKESGRKIISRDTWLGDTWDAMEYGQEIDWTRPFLEQIHELEMKVPMYNFNVIRMINSPYAFNATGLKNSYLVVNSNYSEDCMYGNAIDYCKDYVDNSHIQETERCYECFWLRKCYQCYFTIMSWDSRNLWFSRDCGGCNDCFGCANLRGKSYCIFNKQYTKEGYKALMPKIKKHMDEMPYIDSQGLIYTYGEFFPLEFSPFGYNNTLATQHFPLTKEESLKKGYGWIDRERGEYVITKKASELPEKIADTTEEILKEVIECEKCTFAFKIQPNEFIFYKKENLPVPRLCSECRHERRISDRLTLHLYERSCMCTGRGDETGVYINTVSHGHGESRCGEVFKTGYPPDRPEIVYCEKCYQAEVY